MSFVLILVLMKNDIDELRAYLFVTFLISDSTLCQSRDDRIAALRNGKYAQISAQK
jgi:hypothetical protein